MSENQISQKTVRSILQSGLTLHLMDAKGVEPKLLNYKHKSLPERNWKLLSENGETVALAEWAEWVFVGGKADIYGFFIKDKDGDVLWKEKFKGGPCEVLRKDDKLRIRAKMTFGEE